MIKKIIIVGLIGVMTVALCTLAIPEETQPKPMPKPDPEPVELPALVEEYQQCPIALRRYGKAFFDLAHEYWWSEDWKNSAKNFDIAARIYSDISNVQKRRPGSEKKRRSYAKFIDFLAQSRMNSLIMKARALLKMDDRKKAFNELVRVGRECGMDNRFEATKASIALLKTEFSITHEDLKDLGIEKIYH